MIWNISRVFLILFCGYQVSRSLIDSNQAMRMLAQNEGPASYRATQTPMETKRAIEVLTRRMQPSQWYLMALIVLALCPYSFISRIASEATDVS